MSGIRAFDRQPVASTTNFAVTVWPSDVVTDQSANDLTSRKGREEIKTKILKRLKAQTDVKVHEVLLTDVAVQ